MSMKKILLSIVLVLTGLAVNAANNKTETNQESKTGELVVMNK